MEEKENKVEYPKTFKLVMIRNGQSTYNKDNLFTGLTDVDLTQEGIDDANKAGELSKANSFKFDLCFTSSLKRSIKTAKDRIKIWKRQGKRLEKIIFSFSSKIR